MQAIANRSNIARPNIILCLYVFLAHELICILFNGLACFIDSLFRCLFCRLLL